MKRGSLFNTKSLVTKSAVTVKANRVMPNRKLVTEGKRAKLQVETPKMQIIAMASRDFL
jgi:hypothetical protein